MYYGENLRYTNNVQSAGKLESLINRDFICRYGVKAATLDLGSNAVRRVGSNPTTGTRL